MEFDEPPFIVTIGEDSRLKLDERVFRQIIENAKPPFVVLSVIGSPVSGKSFLLNYILRYLKANGCGNWMGRPELPLGGFPWNQDEDESEELTGVRMFNEIISISDDYDKNNAPNLVLLDIDYHVNPYDEYSVCNYAALEVFCLSISNAVLHVESDGNTEVSNSNLNVYRVPIIIFDGVLLCPTE